MLSLFLCNLAVNKAWWQLFIIFISNYLCKSLVLPSLSNEKETSFVPLTISLAKHCQKLAQIDVFNIAKEITERC